MASQACRANPAQRRESVPGNRPWLSPLLCDRRGVLVSTSGYAFRYRQSRAAAKAPAPSGSCLHVSLVPVSELGLSCSREASVRATARVQRRAGRAHAARSGAHWLLRVRWPFGQSCCGRLLHSARGLLLSGEPPERRPVSGAG